MRGSRPVLGGADHSGVRSVGENKDSYFAILSPGCGGEHWAGDCRRDHGNVPNPVEPEPNRGRQKADALTKVPSAGKHLLYSHPPAADNLPPTLFRGREIAFSVTSKSFAATAGIVKSSRQIKDDLSPDV